MQLLGKQYFEQEEMMSDVPASVSEEASDGMTDDEALETLCEAVSGRPRLPAWMSAAAGMVRDNRRHLVVAASVLVIGFAIYLNWTMAGGNADAVVGTDDISPLTDIVNAASVGEEGALAEDLSVAICRRMIILRYRRSTVSGQEMRRLPFCRMLWMERQI